MNRWLLGFIFIFGCHVQKNNPVHLSGPSIIGGTLVTESDPIHRFTVGLYDKKTRFVCTGSIISENLILTAAHCIESSPENIIIIFGLDFSAYDSNQLKSLRMAHSVHVHPNYKTENVSDLNWNDLAIVQFLGGLPEGYRPIEILKNSNLLKSGTAVQIAGYGATGVDLEEVSFKKDKKFKQGLASGEIICHDKNFNHCYRISFLGTDQLRSAPAYIEGFTEKEIRMNESKGHGTCVGDSGGPLIYQSENTLNLIGVTSRGSLFCDGPAIYTNAVEYLDWIERTAVELK